MQSEHQGLDFNGQDIYAGIDAHLKSWRVSIVYNDISKLTQYRIKWQQIPLPKLTGGGLF